MFHALCDILITWTFLTVTDINISLVLDPTPVCDTQDSICSTESLTDLICPCCKGYAVCL